MKQRLIEVLIVVAGGVLSAFHALAAAPEFGTVFEGHSIPGVVALDDTRAAVEATYGAPESCQDQTVYNSDERGYDGICDFDVSGGGQVTIYFKSIDGNLASGTPDDVVYFIRWTEAAGGWFTTAGVNTILAKNDPEAAAAAYPDADVIRFDWGSIYTIVDDRQGIRILRSPNFYSGTVTVYMSITHPVPPSAPSSPCHKQLCLEQVDLTIVRPDAETAVPIRDARP